MYLHTLTHTHTHKYTHAHTSPVEKRKGKAQFLLQQSLELQQSNGTHTFKHICLPESQHLIQFKNDKIGASDDVFSHIHMKYTYELIYV